MSFCTINKCIHFLKKQFFMLFKLHHMKNLKSNPLILKNIYIIIDGVLVRSRRYFSLFIFQNSVFLCRVELIGGYRVSHCIFQKKCE